LTEGGGRGASASAWLRSPEDAASEGLGSLEEAASETAFGPDMKGNPRRRLLHWLSRLGKGLGFRV